MAMYQSALAAIQAAAFQRVELASGLIANTVSLAYEELAAELQLTASLPRVGRSSAGLIKGFRDFETNPLNEDRVRKELLTYYATTLGVQKDGQQKEAPKADAIVERLKGSGLVLHDLYVRSNPNETGKKSLLDDAGDGSSYSAGHAKLHPIMREVKTRFQLYDILLIDADTRDVVYSVTKGYDFGVNFASRTLQKNGPVDAVDIVLDDSVGDGFACVDYGLYGPAEVPVLSLATLVRNEGDVSGVLLFLVSLEELDRVISNRNTASGSVSYEVYGGKWSRATDGGFPNTRHHLFASDEAQRRFSAFTNAESDSVGSGAGVRSQLCSPSVRRICPESMESDVVWMFVATTPVADVMAAGFSV